MAAGDDIASAERLSALLERHLDLYKQRAAALASEIRILERQSGIADKARLIVQKNLELNRNAIQAEQQVLEKMQAQVAEYNRLRTATSLTVAETGRLAELGERIQQGLADEVKQRTMTLNLAKQGRQATENTVAATQRAVRTTLGISDAWKKSLVGSIAFGGSLKGVSAGLRSSLNTSDTLMSTWMKIAEISMKAALEYDNMAAAVHRIAGTASGMNDLARQTYAVHRANLQYGMGIKESGEVTNTLYTSMASFSHLLPTTAMALQRQVGLLKQVGVDSQTAAQAFNFMDKGLRLSAADSISLSNKLFGLAKALKVPPQVIFRDWQAASSELAKYGAGMTEVFMGLSAQAKNTGLNMSQLISIAKQFDEFDSAGRAVGRLNAILGGPYLNAIEMVYMTETQRIQALRESLSLSGMMWESLSRHERQTIATAAGIRDMTVAAQLFGGTSRQFAEVAASQKALEDRAIEAQSAMRKLQMAAYGLAIAVEPLVDLVSNIASGIAYLTSLPGGKWFMSLTAAVIPATLAIRNFRRARVASQAMEQLLLALTGRNITALGGLSRANNMATASTRRLTLAEAHRRIELLASQPIMARHVGLTQAAGTGAAAAAGPVRVLSTSFGQLVGVLGAATLGFVAVNALLKNTKHWAYGATAAFAGLAVAIAAMKWGPMAALLGPVAGPMVAAAGLGVFAAGIYSAATKAQSIPRRQLGGPVEADQPYLVGEEGREVVVPTQSGTVVNNKGTEDMLGGGGAAGMGELKDAILNLSMRLDNMGQGGGGSQQPIVIELDGNVVGEFAVNKVDQQLGVLS